MLSDNPVSLKRNLGSVLPTEEFGGPTNSRNLAMRKPKKQMILRMATWMVRRCPGGRYLR